MEENIKDELVKEMLIDTLLFWVKKIKRGDCTREQEIMIMNALSEHGGVKGTIDEMAAFYGVSKDAINGIIKRKYIGKPQRNVVLYSFSQFSRLVPTSWRRKCNKSTQ